MHAGSTLFFDVAAQRDCWPGGAWPLVGAEEAANVARLFALAARLGIRQGGAVCLHAHPGVGADAPTSAGASGRGEAIAVDATPDAPPHCLAGTEGTQRAPACDPSKPLRCWTRGRDPAAAVDLDRAHADYVASGCAATPDAPPLFARVLDHVTAGIRDAVVLGAGIEHGLDRAVDALLRRRIRTHVALDATGSATPEHAQQVIAGWKRRFVDVTTTAMIERLLTRAD
jgi:nicotinamidase-related amidase